MQLSFFVPAFAHGSEVFGNSFVGVASIAATLFVVAALKSLYSVKR